jgi:hypothetical protein
MIKLKNLLTEGEYLWDSPNGTPEEVINTVHEILRVVERDAPMDVAMQWFHITHAPKSEGGDWWIIDKSIKRGQRYWILAFNIDTKHWQTWYIEQGRVHRIADLNNQASVNYMIDKWVKGL